MAGLLCVTACRVDAFAPGERCWWKYSGAAFVYDTVWNTAPTTPDALAAGRQPFMLVGRTYFSDSTRVCR